MITHVSPLESELFEYYAEEYVLQRECGLVNPDLIWDFSKNSEREEGLLVSKSEKGIIEGLLLYRQMPFSSLDNLSQQINSYCKIETRNKAGKEITNPKLTSRNGFKHYSGKGNIVQPHLMESFKKGTGRKLIDALKEVPNTELIFVDPMATVVDFYRKVGFVQSGIYTVSTNNPLMAMHIKV